MISHFEIEPSWQAVLKDELAKPYITSLAAFVANERAGSTPVYPPQELMFNALLQTPFDQVKVVIVGQDPYHGPGQAHGLCFSVPKGIPPPPSLKNIFKELVDDVGIPEPPHGCLLSWAKQGVLLLNTMLTVRQSEPLSHQKRGWEHFTDAIIHKLAQRQDPMVFLLWGKSAQEKFKHSHTAGSAKIHAILTAPHPSPLSAHQGFFGCRHFSKTNEQLKKWGKAPIDWSIS